MKVTFVSGKYKRIKVGDAVPFGIPIAEVEWSDEDITPNRPAFDAFMREVIGPRLKPGKMIFSLKAGQEINREVVNHKVRLTDVPG